MPAKSGFERFKFNSSGYIEIMKSPAMQAVLAAKAERVRASAMSQFREPDNWEIFADVEVGRTRARALISGVPARVEADERIMGRALGAAR